jgi:secretion-regulating guanine nucleotide exchange factor
MELYAWGANSHGQLGVGSFSEFELPQKTSVPKEILTISRVAGGGGHTILISDGDL